MLPSKHLPHPLEWKGIAVYVIEADWIDPAKLRDRDYLSAITAGVYVMTADGVPGLCRSGVIGIQHQNNSAWKRLAQLKHGTLKHKGPWRFVFLAPLPTDLGHDLRLAETQLQAALAAAFDVGANTQFHTTDWPRVQAVAAEATRQFSTSMERQDTEELEQALEAYLAAIAEGLPPYAPPRAAVLRALRMSINGQVAQSILAGIRSARTAAAEQTVCVER